MSYETDLDAAIDAHETANAPFEGVLLKKATSNADSLRAFAKIQAERAARAVVVRQAVGAFITDGGSLNAHRNAGYFAATAVTEFRRLNKQFSARDLLDVMKNVANADSYSRRPQWEENIRRLVAAA